jgi:REP element-mobilizing transposase RayT
MISTQVEDYFDRGVDMKAIVRLDVQIPMAFRPIDYFKEITVHRKKLPHWRQDGVTYFVTSRLADSIPRATMAQWLASRQAWLRQNRMEKVADLATQPENIQRAYHQEFTKRFHDLLDACYGSCCLRQPDVSKLLATLLVGRHEVTCDLDAWVIMPNHFHALVSPRAGVTLGMITKKWKGGSGREINLLLGKRGRLWQPEGFDHIVRSEAQFQHYQRYIVENPTKAGLSHGFVLGIGSECGLSKEEMLSRL